MRYLPLTPDDRAEMLGAIGAASIDDLFVDVPASARRDGLVDLPLPCGRAGGRARAVGAGRRATGRRAQGPFFCGAGAYRHHVPASVDHLIQRSRVPDLLHALPARDRPGHAAGAVRVPDPGGGADRHGGGQRLALRRLHRRGRGGDDGRPHHPAEQGGAVAAACTPTTPRRSQTLAHAAGMEIERLPLAIDAEAERARPPRAPTSPAWWCRRRTCSARPPTSPPIAEAAQAAGALLIVVTTEVGVAWAC